MAQPYDPQKHHADLRTFVQTVSRAFYDAPHVILLDQLLKRDAFREDDLAALTGVGQKDLAKLAGPLIADGLVKRFERSEHREPNPPPFARPVNRRYYWIDFPQFTDVVRWRMGVLFKSLDTKLRAEQENKGYLCPACHKTYSPLHVPLQLTASGGFPCDVCGAELVHNDQDDGVKGRKDRMRAFNGQTKWIQEGLRKAGDLILPKLDIHRWLLENARMGEATDHGGIQVDLLLDGEGEAERREREAKRLGEEQRSQNSLPAWHLYSTVSGQQTALGIQHAAQVERAEAGLSFANGGDREGKVDERVLGSLDDYYRQRQSSNLLQPKVEDQPPVVHPFGAAPSSSVKRERSPSPGLTEGGGKRLRSDEGGLEAGPGVQEGEDAGEQMVTVAGVEKRFEDVTEEDQELMTPEEYTLYAELFQELNF